MGGSGINADSNFCFQQSCAILVRSFCSSIFSRADPSLKIAIGHVLGRAKDLFRLDPEPVIQTGWGSQQILEAEAPYIPDALFLA